MTSTTQGTQPASPQEQPRRGVGGVSGEESRSRRRREQNAAQDFRSKGGERCVGEVDEGGACEEEAEELKTQWCNAKAKAFDNKRKPSCSILKGSRQRNLRSSTNMYIYILFVIYIYILYIYIYIY